MEQIKLFFNGWFKVATLVLVIAIVQIGMWISIPQFIIPVSIFGFLYVLVLHIPGITDWLEADEWWPKDSKEPFCYYVFVLDPENGYDELFLLTYEEGEKLHEALENQKDSRGYPYSYGASTLVTKVKTAEEAIDILNSYR